ncbi:uncharacterized protein BDZ99DRAFT_498135 [Mytilinidion resinicola]|uniref:Uncharacterized protein n=1 Tax=Mytilinidion resinicola TaxID=574789 RepID=A0A6A6YPU2_9PEZI|nr:uncharacterized protein BDZ99DRAFT_498135 [Mytilinidion resinicola]KAF2809887.1 hypothetical protein BDZ99DRAFT_498135 [Mytilinidion resinicola]
MKRRRITIAWGGVVSEVIGVILRCWGRLGFHHKVRNQGVMGAVLDSVVWEQNRPIDNTMGARSQPTDAISPTAMKECSWVLSWNLAFPKSKRDPKTQYGEVWDHRSCDPLIMWVEFGFLSQYYTNWPGMMGARDSIEQFDMAEVLRSGFWNQKAPNEKLMGRRDQKTMCGRIMCAQLGSVAITAACKELWVLFPTLVYQQNRY